MAAIIERRVTRAAGWSRRLGAFSFVLFVTAGLSHRYQYLETPAFLWVLALVAGLSLLALVCGLFAFRRYWVHDDLGSGDLTVGIAMALVTLTPFAISGYRYVTHPELTDISTDVKDPPALADASVHRLAGMNPIVPVSPENAAVQLRDYPAVTGHHYDLPSDQVVEVIEVLAADKGWVLSSSAQNELGNEFTFECGAGSPILRLPADVAIRIVDVDNGSEVDMRSASRYGPHDLGDNAARIEAFLADLDLEVARRTAGIAPGVVDSKPRLP